MVVGVAVGAIDRLVVFDAPKEAVPDGTVPVLQLEPVRKSPLPGAASQVAFCAAAGVPTAASAVVANSAARSRLLPTPRSPT